MRGTNRICLLVMALAAGACGLDENNGKDQCSVQADCLDGYVCDPSGTCVTPDHCTPRACAADQCEVIDNGCGGTINCGGCDGALVCGSVEPNVCGPAPDYCANNMLDANRGETGIDCGGSCGGCPTGGACNTTDDCAAGNTCEDHACLAGVWSTAAEMPTGRFDLAAVVAPDGKIYAIGGYNFAGVTGVVEVYNPATNSWSTRAPMPTPRYGVAAVVAPDGLIYVIGGQYNDQSIPSSDGNSVKVEAYDPVHDTWSAQPSLPNGRYHPAATVGTDGAIYVTGGFSVNPVETLATTSRYMPGDAAWTTLSSPMTSKRSGHAVVGTSDGKIYAFAGYSGSTELVSAEYMEPGTPGWNTLPPMTYYRKYTAATISGGRVYVIGGNAPGVAVFNPVVEVFTPGANTWSFAASMPVGRYGNAAVTLSDGRIFVIGGERETGLSQGEPTGVVDVLTP